MSTGVFTPTVPDVGDIILGDAKLVANKNMPDEFELGALSGGVKLNIARKFEDIKFDGAYGHQLDSDGVPLRRIMEFVTKLTAEMLTIRYQNKKIISNCESDDTWQSGDWAEGGGTYAAETTIVLEGNQSAKCTADTTVYGIHNPFASSNNLAVFDNSEVSSTSDYICFAIYIDTTNAGKLNTDGIKILFHKDAELTKTNYWYYDISKATFAVNGWNVFKIAKSSFTAAGSAADWTAITGVSFELNGAPSGSLSFYVDDITLVQAQTKGTIVPLNGAANFSMTDEGDYKSIVGDLEITDTDYYNNVALVGTKMDGKEFIAILYNVAHNEEIDLALKEKDNIVNSVELVAHFDRSTPATTPFEIRNYV
jgi:hypothetical protein